MTGAAATVLTCDRFLGARVVAEQPARGFRSGTDAVLLAAAVPAAPGDTVLELGCGAGVASLCLMARVADISVTGVEILPDLADLARRNARRNAMRLDVVAADVAALPADLRTRSFDHVIANPPYFEPWRGPEAADAVRAMGCSGPLPLADWADAALRRLRPGGRLTFIQRADRLPELLAGLDGRLGGIRVLPISGRAGRAADRIVLHGRKGARAPFRLLSPLVMHDGTVHGAKDDGFTAAALGVLRQCHALPVDWA